MPVKAFVWTWHAHRAVGGGAAVRQQRWLENMAGTGRSSLWGLIIQLLQSFTLVPRETQFESWPTDYSQTTLISKARLTLPPWSCSSGGGGGGSSSRERKAQNEPALWLIGELCWSGLWLTLNLNESVQKPLWYASEEGEAHALFTLFILWPKRHLGLEPGEKSKRIPEIPLIIYLHMIIVKILKERNAYFSSSFLTFLLFFFFYNLIHL